ncbi:MAG: quinone-dependent dihydroorotate dehydrogenase [Acidobacteria bacterium]|nr:quinone-dependent dihydroorotate dehydrogenase [Acidobacteriota bacterium]
MLYRSILRPLLFRLPPETAHELALKTLSRTLKPQFIRQLMQRRYASHGFGELRRFGLRFSNPVGVAAGFDKNGVALEQLAALGFGFVEAGTVTHLKQPGNPQPRLFRLPPDRALINRQGFNNHGAAALAARLSGHRADCVVGINIGKSRAVELEDATADYLASFELVHAHADYIAVNVSSPNTPNLRELQRADALKALLTALQEKNLELSGRNTSRREPVPLLVKIAPDLELPELEAIVDVALRANLSGIIATNTTTSRAGLRTPEAVIKACGAGGLSGAPLQHRSNEIIRTLYRLTKGRLTIIGVGGVFTAADAWEKICAGASLVQLYTGFVYQGWGIAREINEGLAEILSREKIGSLDEAVGCRAK